MFTLWTCRFGCVGCSRSIARDEKGHPHSHTSGIWPTMHFPQLNVNQFQNMTFSKKSLPLRTGTQQSVHTSDLPMHIQMKIYFAKSNFPMLHGLCVTTSQPANQPHVDRYICSILVLRWYFRCAWKTIFCLCIYTICTWRRRWRWRRQQRRQWRLNHLPHTTLWAQALETACLH